MSVQNRKLVFYAMLLTLFFGLFSFVACHDGHSSSLTDSVLNPLPEDPGADDPGADDEVVDDDGSTPDDGTLPGSDDESDECATEFCAP